jgi:rhamnogalacturonyl hydrolase YesR
LRKLLSPVLTARDRWQLPSEAKSEIRKDRGGPPERDPGIDVCVREAIDWIGRAQDASLTHDGGVARHYSLTKGWAPSYPETTGYIIPTLLDFARRTNSDEIRDRAKRMLDWCLKIQFPDGAFQGGIIGSQPVVPVTFNTGQILLGLAAGAREFGEPYLSAMVRAADWLVRTQDPDGAWHRNSSPFASPGTKAYDTHVAWALFEAARVASETKYSEAGLANVRWALSQQRDNGWFMNCCLSDYSIPLTHTLGYALRGLLEAHRYSNDASLLQAARKTADGLMSALRRDGGLPGCLASDWSPATKWVCLTGAVQVAYCWLYLYQVTGEDRYREAAQKANLFVRRTQDVTGRPEVRGAIKGSFPVDGEYGSLQYLNWAAKFFVDSNLYEKDLCMGRK